MSQPLSGHWLGSNEIEVLVSPGKLRAGHCDNSSEFAITLALLKTKQLSKVNLAANFVTVISPLLH